MWGGSPVSPVTLTWTAGDFTFTEANCDWRSALHVGGAGAIVYTVHTVARPVRDESHSTCSRANPRTMTYTLLPSAVAHILHRSNNLVE